LHHLVEGSYYDLGFEIGRTHTELIRFIVLRYATYHAPAPRPGMCPQLEEALAYLRERFPWAVEEIRGYGEGSGIGFEEMAFFFCFGFGREGLLSCSNIAFSDSDHGPLLAGNLDDPPWHHLVSFVPEDSHAATFVHIPGMPCAWGGMNERGLCISGSSASLPPRYGRPPEPSREQAWTRYLTVRFLLHRASSVEEALGLFREQDFAGAGNYIFLDSSGRGVVLEKVGSLELGMREMEGGWVACGNLFPSKVGEEDLEDEGLSRALSGAGGGGGGGPHTLEAARAVLTSHGGDPGKMETVCNDGTSCSMICLPAEGRVLFAHRLPCQNEFEEYRVPRGG